MYTMIINRNEVFSLENVVQVPLHDCINSFGIIGGGARTVKVRQANYTSLERVFIGD